MGKCASTNFKKEQFLPPLQGTTEMFLGCLQNKLIHSTLLALTRIRHSNRQIFQLNRSNKVSIFVKTIFTLIKENADKLLFL